MLLPGVHFALFSPQDVLLRTQLHIPGERAYTLPMDLVWDTTRGWTAGSLRQRVADFYSLPVEKIEIAKYFPEKFEWLPISSWVSWAFSEKAELVDLTIEQSFSQWQIVP